MMIFLLAKNLFVFFLDIPLQYVAPIIHVFLLFFCFFHYAYDTVILWIFLLILNVVSFAIVHFVIYLWDSPSQPIPHHLPYTPPSQRPYIPTRLQIPPTPCSSPCSPYLSPISSPRRHMHRRYKSSRSIVRPRHLPPPPI